MSGREVKAIPTEYAGVLFRSRLEARWALFFDRLRVKWLYEHEGFQLEAGWYLPDFYLPEISTWVEIKPTAPTEREETLCRQLADQTKQRVVLLFGEPGGWLNVDEETNFSGARGGAMAFASGEHWGGDDYLLCVCYDCGKLGFEYQGRSARICGHDPTNDKAYNADDPKIVAAAREANLHRFGAR